MSRAAERRGERLRAQVPTLRELYHYVVVRVSHKWDQLGVYLELDKDGAKLAAIKRSNIQLGVETCCMQMFMVWLREGKRELVNWGTIFSCLEDIGSKAIIKEITKNLAEDDVSSTDEQDSRAGGITLPPDLLSTPEARRYHLKPAVEEELRDYQWELAMPGLGGLNYIVCAPTGSGKTRVAGLVISEHLKKQKGRGRVLFLVNKVPLVQQQQRALQEMIHALKSKAITGDLAQHKKAVLSSSFQEEDNISSAEEENSVAENNNHSNATEKLKFSLDNDLIVCTAGCFFNELDCGKLSLSGISLLVIDECHNTRKNSDYAKIMELYIRASRKEVPVPQVMGLTATPGAGEASRPTLNSVLDHMMSLCAAMDATGGIKIVQRNLPELKLFQASAIHTRAVLEGRSDQEPFITIIVQVMSKIEDLYKKCFRAPSSSKWSEEYRGWVDQEIHQSQELGHSRDKLSILKTLKGLASTLRVYQILTLEDAMNELQDLQYPSLAKATQTEQLLSKMVAQLKVKLHSLEKVENPMLLLLEDTLESKFTAISSTKAIVFVEKRREAACVERWLASRPKLQHLIHSKVVTGQTGDTGEKMTKAEQSTSLESFRGQECNLLVATSVLEEGLDVPACNLVITYQKVTSEIAQVQGKGRARASQSQTMTIVTSDSGKQFQEMINEEKNLLVEQALEMLPTGEDLCAKILEKQADILKRSELRREEATARRQLYSPEEVSIHCAHCSAYLCSGVDIHTIPTTLQYVVSNTDFLSHVEVQEHPRPNIQSKGLSRTHKILCKHCETQSLGVIGKWWKNNVQYPVIKCKYVKFMVKDKVIPCKQWKNSPFDITPLH